MPAAQASCNTQEGGKQRALSSLFVSACLESNDVLNLGLGAKRVPACKYSPAEHRKSSETGGPPHLSVIQVTEASDDLLLVQLVSFQLHASNGLHGAVVLQALLPGELRRLRGAIL